MDRDISFLLSTSKPLPHMGVKSYSIASEQWGWLEYDLKRRTSIRRDARKASKTWLDFWKETKSVLFELESQVMDRVISILLTILKSTKRRDVRKMSTTRHNFLKETGTKKNVWTWCISSSYICATFNIWTTATHTWLHYMYILARSHYGYHDYAYQPSV